MKQLFSLLLSTLLVCPILDARADLIVGTCGEELSYTLDTVGHTLTISGRGAMSDYPEADAPWWDYRSQIDTLRLPDDLTTVGTYAFFGLDHIRRVVIPDSVTTIGDYAFLECSAIDSLTIGLSVAAIGQDAFQDCNALRHVQWNAAVCASPSARRNAPFYGQRADIESLRIGDGVRELPAWLCYGMSQLTSIELPGSVTACGQGIFQSCTGLRSVTLSARLRAISPDMFSGCTALSDISLPNSVTAIGAHAFEKCTALTTFYTGKRVTSIDEYALGDCTALTQVRIGFDMDAISPYAFDGCSALEEVQWSAIRYPSAASAAASPWYHLRGQLRTFTFSDEVEVIPAYLCYGMTEPDHITLPEEVTTIGAEAFCGCTGLTDIQLPNSLSEIGAGAFAGCTGLTTIQLPSGLTVLPDRLCAGCTGLTSVTLPRPVEQIGADAFRDCIALPALPLPQSVSAVGARCFAGCTALTEFSLPQQVRILSDSLFLGCKRLRSVAMPTEVQRIGAGAFATCDSLVSFALPDSLTYIGAAAFYRCNSLTDMLIPSGVTYIGRRAFSRCDSIRSFRVATGNRAYRALNGVLYDYDTRTLLQYPLTREGTYTLPDTVVVVAEEAFAGAARLTSITLPSVLTTIEPTAFAESGLTFVLLPHPIDTLHAHVFAGCDSLRTVTLGTSMRYLDAGALADCAALEHIYSYAETVPEVCAEDEPLRNVSRTAVIHAYSDMLPDYRQHEYWGEFGLATLSAELSTGNSFGNVQVIPGTNTAQFSWYNFSSPAEAADYFRLDIILAEGDTVTSLSFNVEDGTLRTVRFDAPTPRMAPGKQDKTTIYTYTVIGLLPDTEYQYRMTVWNEEHHEHWIGEYHGTFRTGQTLGIESAAAESHRPDGKYIEDGRPVIVRHGIRYSATGKRL